MTGLLVLVSAVAAVSSAAASGVTEQVLGGGRYLQETLYCNSIGCTNGFRHIDDAQNVECDSDPCEVDQCCKLFCNSASCPSGAIAIMDAQTTVCDADPCDPAQCCDLFCNSIGCPSGSIAIMDAQTTLCDADPCDPAQCCE